MNLGSQMADISVDDQMPNFKTEPYGDPSLIIILYMLETTKK